MVVSHALYYLQPARTHLFYYPVGHEGKGKRKSPADHRFAGRNGVLEAGLEPAQPSLAKGF